MRTFLVSYDLADPARNRDEIVAAIMALGSAWARPLDTVWYLRAEECQAEIEARLSRHLADSDGLLIQETRGEAAMLNTGLRWFRQRKADGAGQPARHAVAHNVTELPFAPARRDERGEASRDERNEARRPVAA